MPAPALGLEGFNKLSERQQMHLLFGVCSSPIWARRVLAGAPFGSVEVLLDRADRVLAELPDAEIDAALDGSKSIGEVISVVEPRLWNMATVLPILQDTTIVAVGPNVTNVSMSGAVPVGIVGDAGGWVKRP